MRNGLLLFALLLLSSSGFSQSHLVYGQVVDAEEGSALPGAYIRLYQGDREAFADATNDSGHFALRGIPAGDFRVEVSYLGYSPWQQEITVTDASVDLGIVRLLTDAVQLEQVQVVENAATAIQRGDTTEINAGAYQTLPDASAEDLLRKLPTVTSQNGQVEAQGERVQRVLVDGRPFFGNDPTAALRNLPAEVIEKIQIYDQQSDQSQFTGFDDGNATKTINIITRSDARAGQFGKVYAGYGTDDRYMAGGNINFFNGQRRISLIGMANNVNQQNFASEDLLGVVGGSGGSRRGRRRGGGGSGDFLVPTQGGISATQALGINFNDKWGDKWDVNASYFFNRSDNEQRQLLNRYFVSSDEIYEETSINSSINQNHRINGRIEYELNDNNSFHWRPSLSWQRNDGASDLLGQNLGIDALLAETNNQFAAELRALNFDNNLLWRHRLAKERRTFSINLRTGFSPQKGNNQLLATNFYADQVPAFGSLDQSTTLDGNSWNASIDFSYTEPVGENGMLMFSSETSYQQQDNDQSTYDFNPANDDYDLINRQLSSVFTYDYLEQEVEVGYNYRVRNLFFMLELAGQYSELLNDQAFPMSFGVQRSFTNLLPMAMLRFGTSRTNSVFFRYRASTDLPSLSQLQEVLDNSNPLLLSVGNSALDQALEHQFMLRYNKTNTDKGTVVFAFLNGRFTQNYIANSSYLPGSEAPIRTLYQVPAGAQLSRPTNIDGYWNVRGLLTYGFPLLQRALNLNVDLNLSYVNTPSLVNKVRNESRNASGGLGLTISSGFSERVDFTLSSRSNINQVRNTLTTAGESDFFSQVTRFNFDWIAPGGWTLRSDLQHQYYDGLGDDFDPDYWLWSLSIGKKVLKQRGEIALGVFDVLKENNSLSRNVTEIYFEDSQTNVLQQYFMLRFIYDVRHFGEPPAAEERPSRDFRPWGG